MKTIVKPQWYIDFNWWKHPRWRFFIGRVGYPNRNGEGTKFWCITIGLYFIDFGRAY